MKLEETASDISRLGEAQSAQRETPVVPNRGGGFSQSGDTIQRFRQGHQAIGAPSRYRLRSPNDWLLGRSQPKRIQVRSPEGLFHHGERFNPFVKGTQGNKDVALAVRYYRRAAEKGHSAAASRYDDLYFRWTDPAKPSDEQPFRDAMNRITGPGHAYQTGLTYEERGNAKKALAWYQAAAGYLSAPLQPSGKTSAVRAARCAARLLKNSNHPLEASVYYGKAAQAGDEYSGQQRAMIEQQLITTFRLGDTSSGPPGFARRATVV